MKRTALALAAMVALSGVAFAGETTTNQQIPAACAQTATKTRLDCAATGSIEKTRPATSESKRPRLGIEASPWIMPTTF